MSDHAYKLLKLTRLAYRYKKIIVRLLAKEPLSKQDRDFLAGNGFEV